MGGTLVFLTLAGFIGVGVIWFYILRPILEDVGLLAPRASVNDYAEPTPRQSAPASGITEVVSGGGISIIPPQDEPPPARDLTEVEVARWLAKHNSADTLSANRIYDLVRGNRNEVLRAVREARGGAAFSSDAPTAPRELVVREYGRERRLAMTDPDFPYEAPPA